MQIPIDKRNCYELIPKTDLCAGFLVLKWTGAPDPEHTTLHEVLERLRLRCGQELGIAVDPCSYCGTHPIKGSADVQHVYHVVVQNLVFQNNHNGQMRAFFDLGVPEINLNVYTRNRQLLLPYCCPAGVTVPLEKVDQHAAFFSVGSTLWQSQAFVTGPDIPTASQYLFNDVRNQEDLRWAPLDTQLACLDRPQAVPPPKPKQGPGRPPAKAKQAVASAREDTAPPEPASKRPRTTEAPAPPVQPFPTASLEDLFLGAGIHAPFGGPPRVTLARSGRQQWTFRSQAAQGGCLKCPGEKHGFSVLVRGSDCDFTATYQCDQGMCWNIPDFVLGTVFYDQGLQRWAHQLAPKLPVSVVDDTMLLPFPTQLLTQLLPSPSQDPAQPAAAASYYLKDRGEWRVHTGPTVLLVKYQAGHSAGHFAVVQQPDRQPLGSVWLTSHGTWAATPDAGLATPLGSVPPWRRT